MPWERRRNPPKRPVRSREVCCHSARSNPGSRGLSGRVAVRPAYRTQGIRLRLQPWARLYRPVGPGWVEALSHDLSLGACSPEKQGLQGPQGHQGQKGTPRRKFPCPWSPWGPFSSLFGFFYSDLLSGTSPGPIFKISGQGCRIGDLVGWKGTTLEKGGPAKESREKGG